MQQRRCRMWTTPSRRSAPSTRCREAPNTNHRSNSGTPPRSTPDRRASYRPTHRTPSPQLTRPMVVVRGFARASSTTESPSCTHCNLSPHTRTGRNIVTQGVLSRCNHSACVPAHRNACYIGMSLQGSCTTFAVSSSSETSPQPAAAQQSPPGTAAQLRNRT